MTVDIFHSEDFRTIKRLLGEILRDQSAILDILRTPKATRIKIGVPLVTRKGIPVSNIELKDDLVYTFPILTDAASGAAVSPPAGDTFSAVSSNPASLGAAISIVSGNAMLVLTPLVQASPNLTVTVSDSAGLTSDTVTFDIVQDLTPTSIALGTPTTAPQPVPTAPGP